MLKESLVLISLCVCMQVWRRCVCVCRVQKQQAQAETIITDNNCYLIRLKGRIYTYTYIYIQPSWVHISCVHTQACASMSMCNIWALHCELSAWRKSEDNGAGPNPPAATLRCGVLLWGLWHRKCSTQKVGLSECRCNDVIVIVIGFTLVLFGRHCRNVVMVNGERWVTGDGGGVHCYCTYHMLAIWMCRDVYIWCVRVCACPVHTPLDGYNNGNDGEDDNDCNGSDASTTCIHTYSTIYIYNTTTTTTITITQPSLQLQSIQRCSAIFS